MLVLCFLACAVLSCGTMAEIRDADSGEGWGRGARIIANGQRGCYPASLRADAN